MIVPKIEHQYRHRRRRRHRLHPLGVLAWLLGSGGKNHLRRCHRCPSDRRRRRRRRRRHLRHRHRHRLEQCTRTATENAELKIIMILN